MLCLITAGGGVKGDVSSNH